MTQPPSFPSYSQPLSQCRRVVVKLGTHLLMGDDGELARDHLAHLVAQCAALVHKGRQLLVVSSGSVGLGAPLLGLAPPMDLVDRQACAAVGQNLLMETYRQCFQNHGLCTAQILVSASDFAHRQTYLNLEAALSRLLALGVVPIINENDTVSTVELAQDATTRSFGDNDNLSALVTAKLNAEALLLLTVVDGLYNKNPHQHPDATIIPVVEDFQQCQAINVEGTSAMGRGGMASKLEAARIASMGGAYTVIASGLRPNVIRDLMAGETSVGTVILPQPGDPLSSRRRWIGLASGYQGVVQVNAGAKQALTQNGASLLAVGIMGVRGEFRPKDVVSLQDSQGNELGRGVVNFSAAEVQKIQGCSSPEISHRLGRSVPQDVVIHRDNLVIFQEEERL